MRRLELTLDTPAENLALDEALLLAAEADPDSDGEVLRLWEPAAPLVVLGSSSKVAIETHSAACAARGIPILRRVSGGAAILTGPGCLMYAVVLSYRRRPALRMIEAVHAFVLDTIIRALDPLAPGVARQGTSDLAIDGRKFSGNALRVKRDHVLYHGTLLYNFPLPLIAECLGPPPRQPDYRAGRDHAGFVTNLSASAAEICNALATAFDAQSLLHDWPHDIVDQLVRDKYSQDAWNLRH